MRLIRYSCIKNGQNTNMLVEQYALMHVFRKRQGCVLIGACVLIRMNTVIYSKEK